MALAARIAALASRIGLEVKAKIDQAHPGLARAWVSFGVVDGEVLIHAAYSVATVERLASGRYRIHFATPMPDVNYCWLAFARSNTNSGTQRLAIARARSDEKTESYVDVACATVGGTFADTAELNVVVYR